MAINSTESSPLVVYRYAPEAPLSSLIRVQANGLPVPVCKTGIALYACVGVSGPVQVEVESDQVVRSVTIRPLNLKIQARCEGNKVSFTLPRPLCASIEINEMPPLYFFANAADPRPPRPGDRGVHFFAGGRIYEVGELELKDNETLYIEGGAIVRGVVRARHARNVRIGGHGVLDGRNGEWGGARPRAVVFDHCSNVRVDGIIMVNPALWMLSLGACEHVEVAGLKQIGEVMCSDGVDICGSRHVRIHDCFLRNNDDCIAIKAVLLDDAGYDWRGNVEDVLVENCVLLNDPNGNATEIGYELCADQVRDITFRNCDILHVHGRGAAFAIHAGDRALVSDVLYEDIRVEHHWDKLFDFRVVDSKYSRDSERGQIRNITLRRITAAKTVHNLGYTISLISGFDPGHTVENVIFEEFVYGGTRVSQPHELYMMTRDAAGIVIR